MKKLFAGLVVVAFAAAACGSDSEAPVEETEVEIIEEVEETTEATELLVWEEDYREAVAATFEETIPQDHMILACLEIAELTDDEIAQGIVDAVDDSETRAVGNYSEVILEKHGIEDSQEVFDQAVAITVDVLKTTCAG